MWKWFSQDEDGERMTCTTCGTHLTGRNVSSAIRHLSLHHQQYDTFVRTEAKRLPNKLNLLRLQKLLSKQQHQQSAAVRQVPTKRSYVTIEVVPAPTATRTRTQSVPSREGKDEKEQKELKDKRQEKFRHILVELVTSSAAVPAHVVDDAVFRKMVKFLDPDVRLPSRETLVRDVTRVTQQQVLRDMRDMVAQAARVSIAFAVCEKKTAAHHMLAVAAFFWHSASNQKTVLTLALRPVAADPDQIQSLLLQVLSEFAISSQQVLRLLPGPGCRLTSTSNAIVSPAAQSDSDLLHDDCPDVFLTLCEQPADECVTGEWGQKRMQCFVRLLDAVWKRVEKKCVLFEQSVQSASRVMRAMRGRLGLDDAGRCLTAGQVSRWVPLFAKMQHMVRSRQSVDRLCDEDGVEKVSEQDWRRLTQYDQLLSPFKLIRDQQTRHSSAGLSRVLPAVLFLTDHLTTVCADPDPDLRQVACDMLTDLRQQTQHLSDARVDDVYLMATAVDPAVHKLLTAAQVADAFAGLRALSSNFQCLVSDPAPSPDRSRSPDAHDELVDDFHKFVTQSHSLPPAGRLDGELRDFCQFVSENSVSVKTDPLQFWSSDPVAGQMPLLRRVALHLLSVPSHACHLEQVFVAAGQASAGRRHRISAEHLQAQVLLRTNRPFVRTFATDCEQDCEQVDE